ncbi:hypothetical protein ACVWZ6_001234 [Bradyrhizobium sp. GM6.1]
MKGAVARKGGNYRLIGKLDAALIQCGDDLVGDADVDAALGVARGIRAPGCERADAALFRGVQGLVGAIDGFIGVAGIARHADRADRGGDRHRSGFGRHHLVANAGEETFGSHVHVIDGAVLQDQAELVAGEAAEHVAAAQARANARGDVEDHGVGNVEAEGLVDTREMIDADQHEGRGRAETGRLLDGLGQRGDQMRAIELAGQRIEPGQLRQFLVAGMAFIVDADGADRTHRATVGAGEPAAGLLDPDHGIGGAHAHAVLDPVGRAVGAMHG